MVGNASQQAPSMTPSEQALREPPSKSPSEPLLATDMQGESSAVPISISSSPDPINTIVPTQPRRSKRWNAGIPAPVYHDPNALRMKAKLRAHEYKLRKAAKRAGSVATDASNDASTDTSKASLAIKRIIVDGKPLTASEIAIPTTYKQAEKTPHWQHWKQAMEDQIEDLNAKNTYTLIIRPRKTQVLPGQWRFSIKKDAHDYATGFKAR